MAETGAAIDVISMVIRTAMGDDFRHSPQGKFVDRRFVCVMIDAADSTHNSPIIARTTARGSFRPLIPRPHSDTCARSAYNSLRGLQSDKAVPGHGGLQTLRLSHSRSGRAAGHVYIQ